MPTVQVDAEFKTGEDLTREFDTFEEAFAWLADCQHELVSVLIEESVGPV